MNKDEMQCAAYRARYLCFVCSADVEIETGQLKPIPKHCCDLVKAVLEKGLVFTASDPALPSFKPLGRSPIAHSRAAASGVRASSLLAIVSDVWLTGQCQDDPWNSVDGFLRSSLDGYAPQPRKVCWHRQARVRVHPPCTPDARPSVP